MKKYLYLVLLPIFALVLAGCNPFTKGVLDITEADKTAETKKGQPTGEAPKESFTGNIKEMIALGKPMKCAWKKDNENYGESYIKGKQVYGEVTVSGKKGYIIMKDNCFWDWTEDQNKGIKMCSGDQEEVDQPDFENEQEDVFNKLGIPPAGPAEIDYNCIPAVIDDDRFSLPADVNFMEFDDMTQPEM